MDVPRLFISDPFRADPLIQLEIFRQIGAFNQSDLVRFKRANYTDESHMRIEFDNRYLAITIRKRVLWFASVKEVYILDLKSRIIYLVTDNGTVLPIEEN